MAWTTPPTVVTGDLITSAWGNLVRDNLRYLKGSDGTIALDATITIGGADVALAGEPISQFSNDAGYLTSGSITTGPITTKIHSLAALATARLGNIDKPTAKVCIHGGTAFPTHYAEFYVDGTNNSVSVITDRATMFSTTAGTSFKHNVYYSSGNARYEIENQAGGLRTYHCVFIGFSS